MITSIDYEILYWIQNNLRFEWITWFWKLMSMLADKGILMILTALLLLCFKKTRRIGIIMTAALALNVLVVNIIVKPLIARPRPFALFTDLIPLVTKLPKDYSFPSGHTSASFATAEALFLAVKNKHKKWASFGFVLAVLVGFSRLYLGVHYPSDVLVGGIIGFLAAVIAYFTYENLRENHRKAQAAAAE